MPAPEPHFNWQEALAAAAAAGDERPTWAYDWPVGGLLARALPELIEVGGRRVCDLGCGRGQLGLRALELQAAGVCFADASPEVLAYIRALVADDPRAQVAVHRWGEPLPDGPYQLILGGDILYRPECQPALIATIAKSLHRDGLALLADPRQGLEPALPELAADAGLRWQQERLESGITLIRMHLAAL